METRNIKDDTTSTEFLRLFEASQFVKSRWIPANQEEVMSEGLNGGGPLVGCRLKFSNFVGSRLKFSIFVGSRLNFSIFVGCRKISVNK